MRWTSWLMMLFTAVAALGGCKGKIKRLSEASTLLAHQNEIWERLKSRLQTDTPDWNLFDAMNGAVGETRLRVQKQFGGDRQKQILQTLDAFVEAYRSEALPLLDLSSPKGRPKTGISVEEIRAVVEKLDELYKQVESLDLSQ